MSISIYIHYPFCRSKCPYCDFNSYCNLKIDEEELINAYLNEIEYYKDIIKDKIIDTIYFGGGTPSLMSEKLLSNIMNKINSLYKINKNCEISLESNPNSINYEKLKSFKDIGINRLSIGVQSLIDEDLKFLGRIHNKNEAIEAINTAQKIFNDRYSIDLIYGRPNQNLKEWKNELNEAIQLSPFHISLYQLIIEKGTPFYRNKVQTPNEDIATKLYEETHNILEKNNIFQYEISNYAKNGYECKHNLVYWNNGEWIGIGAGAHGRININQKRYSIQNLKKPLNWLDKTLKNKNGISIKKLLSKQEIIEEYLIMGLRIKDGIKIENLQKNIDCNNFYDILDKNNIEFLAKLNLINVNDKNIKLTKKGFLLLNSVIEKLAPNN